MNGLSNLFRFSEVSRLHCVAGTRSDETASRAGLDCGWTKQAAGGHKIVFLPGR